ncbi:MAG TPA: hypothetical protein VFF29_02055, partial [Bacteroidota bacterium]|nr:hypothetical protein [Bacteroidota bacterium]
DEMAFAVRAFYKDIFDYPSLVRRGSADNNVYRNLDYASSRGFDLTLSRAPVDNFSLSVTYSYQIAKGRSSNTLAALFEPQFQLPRETRLDWDQNHTANVFATYRVGPREEGNFFGLPFVNNYGISFTWSFGSGVPFTPYRGRETVRNAYLKNNETAPYTSTVNLSFFKGFRLTESINLSATFDITNLFNRRNVIAGSIFTLTQRPPQYGDYDPDTKEIYNWADTEKRIDPILFDAPRQIILGLKLNWD